MVRARIVDARQRTSLVPKRLLYFAYAVTSYLIFLTTFLYAIDLVGGFPGAASTIENDKAGHALS